MTLYERHLADVQLAKAALDRIYQPLDYAVTRVDLTPKVSRAFGRCAVRAQKPTQPVAPDAVLTAVEAVRQSKDRGS